MKSDCDHACNNADSEHSSWCIGFEFRDTEKGMCELYEDCSKKADTPASSETAKEHSTPFAAQAAQTASPNVKSEHRCLRVATSDFDTFYDQHIERRYSWGGRDPRETVDTDCEHLCTKATEGNETWCVGYEFTRDGNGTCELYDDCSKKGESPASSPVVTAQEAPAKEAQAAPAKAAPAKAAPAKVERCLRVSDHDFNALFADQLDGSGNAGRKSTKSDCDHACNNADSEHSSWCIGFEFRDTEKGMCELYEDCSKKADTPAPSETAQEHSTPFAAQAAQTAPAQEKPAQEKPAQEKPAQQASSGVGRCLRVSDHEFDSSFSKQGSGNGGRKGTKEDCSKLCSDESSEKHNWCVGFEFRDTEKGTCELYDECTPEVEKERKEAAAKELAAKAAPTKRRLQKAQAAPPTAARCLRVSDHDFGRWFAGSGRKAAQGDCAYACFDPSSEHHTWCIGFEFRDTETGMCELYEGCTQQRAQQQQQSQQQQASLQASTTRAAAAPAAVDGDATLASARAADQAA